MDANGTRFELLLGAADWGRCRNDRDRRLFASADDGLLRTATSGSDVGWDEDRCELTLEAQLFEFPMPPTDRAPALADRRGAAFDRFGNCYWIAANGYELRVRSSGSGVTSHFWDSSDEERRPHERARGDFGAADPPEPPKARGLAGVAVTVDHYLVVGSTEPGGLLVFDLQAGGAPYQLVWPELPPGDPDAGPDAQGRTLVPFDLTARPGGGVFLLDRVHRSLWELDRHLVVVSRGERGEPPPEPPGAFEPSSGPPHRSIAASRASAPSADAWHLHGDPIAIEAARDGSVIVLDRTVDSGSSRLRRYRDGRELGEAVAARDPLIDADVSGYDTALVPAPSDARPEALGRLYVAGAQGNQAFAFDLSVKGEQLEARLVPRYFPMRLFGGKGLAADARQAYYDFGESWIPLVEQPRTRYAEQATVVTPAFDSHTPDCVWHRLRIDACLPPEARIEVSSRAGEDPDALKLEEWRREPALVLRPGGPEQPFDRWHAAGPYGTWELLFQRARGRWLQVRLVLSGDGRTTPRIRALRATYPRFSYLERYLPKVYREDEVSASFLDRFLANFEGTYTEIEDRIAAAQILFDPRSAPSEALDWLAGWFDVALDPAWSEDRRRLFIAHALDFFQARGTIRGVELALRLAHGDGADDEDLFSQPPRGPHRYAARIIERYRTRMTPGIVLGDPTDESGVRLGTVRGRWRPEDGAAALHDRYQKATGMPEFPLAPPDSPGDWRRFSLDTLGFVPSAGGADVPRWQRFLESRYSNIGRLNSAYGRNSAYGSFAEVGLPAVLPAAAAPLRDWYQLEAVLLPMARSAHRFTVLLPVPTDAVHRDELDVPERRRQLALTQRVVELEKPAHTVFDVRFFWSAFRLGEARLGEDTVIDHGSRLASLVSPAVLGHGHVGEVVVQDPRPPDLPPRPRLSE
jgi:phage tail-like protein